MLLVEKASQSGCGAGKRLSISGSRPFEWMEPCPAGGSLQARGSIWAREAGLSRIYGGIHYPSDERAGNQMGQGIGAVAVQRDRFNR